MANRKRAVTDAPDQATSQRPDPSNNTAPSQPSPTEIPPPPAAPVTQDQFAMLVQLVQALLQLVHGLLGGLLPAAPTQQLPGGTVTPVLPVLPPPNPLEATGLPRQPGHREVEPAPRRGGDRSLPRYRRARSLPPVFSRDNSTPRPRSPRPVSPTARDDGLQRQLRAPNLLAATDAINLISNAHQVRPSEEENQFERVRCEGLTSSDEDIKEIPCIEDMELRSLLSNEDLQGIQYPQDMELGSSPSNEDLQGIQYPEDMEID